MSQRCEWGRSETRGRLSGTRLTTPYNEDWIEAMKDAVPPHARHWDRDQREWWIADEFMDTVAELCDEHFGHAPD